MELYRQGDVLLKRVEKTAGRLVGEGERVLAEGEVTGHRHVLTGATKFFENGNGTVMVEVEEEGALLVHEEHHELQIPAGAYAVVLQREFTAAQAIQKVID